MGLRLRRRELLLGSALLWACRKDESAGPRALGAGFTPLRDDFDADAGKLRVLALLSPT